MVNAEFSKSVLCLGMPGACIMDNHSVLSKGEWNLPAPPSLDVEEGVPAATSGSKIFCATPTPLNPSRFDDESFINDSRYPIFDAWKRDLDSSVLRSSNVQQLERRDRERKNETSCATQRTDIQRKSLLDETHPSVAKENDPHFYQLGSDVKTQIPPSLEDTRSVSFDDEDDLSASDISVLKVDLAELKAFVKQKRERLVTPATPPRSRKHVKFSYPLITTTNYRPKTLPHEVSKLYFQEEELLDWEEDRETTPAERFEMTLHEEMNQIAISSDCRSYSSMDSNF